MKLIDVEKLGVGQCSEEFLPEDYCAAWNSLIDILENAPEETGAVFVVQCKDCEYYTFTAGECGREYIRNAKSDDFCSRGKRRNQDMIARKCDRCGSFYEIKTDDDLFGIKTCINEKDGDVAYFLADYDLCPKCSESFRQWATNQEEQWINVEDRLPKDGIVLVTDGKGVVTAPAVRVIKNGGDVTHWMPLPDPPGDSDAQA